MKGFYLGRRGAIYRPDGLEAGTARRFNHRKNHASSKLETAGGARL